MKQKGFNFLQNLSDIALGPCNIADNYMHLRHLFQAVCHDVKEDYALLPNIFSVVKHLAQIYALPAELQASLDAFNLRIDHGVQKKIKISKKEFLSDVKSLAELLKIIYQIQIPEELEAILPKKNKPVHQQRPLGMYSRIRVLVHEINDDYIDAQDQEFPSQNIKIKYNILGLNDDFTPSIMAISPGTQLNLVDVKLDEEQIYWPELIIVEPDYLTDISALAECMKDYGSHHLHFIYSRLQASQNTKYMLLGNVANLFLDELLHETPENPVSYKALVQKAFKASAFNFATCPDIDRQFFKNLQSQFDNIKLAVNYSFPKHGVLAQQAVLEPSFICENLGIQGRLDLLQLSSEASPKNVVIELKSGKAGYPDDQPSHIALNHKHQAFLYQILIQKILKVPFKDLETYILYSKYPTEGLALRLSKPYMQAIKQILNIRNLLVINEKKIATDPSEQASQELMASIRPKHMILNNKNASFLERFIIPDIDKFTKILADASPLELSYFHSFYHFVCREHYVAKTGDIRSGRKGLSALWLSAVEDKKANGEILLDLSMAQNLSHRDQSTIRFNIPKQKSQQLPNFRAGDVVILYQRNHHNDHVGNKQIFKASIQAIDPQSITLLLRNKQNNASVLPTDSLYAIEQDMLDGSYNAMYKGLFAFLQAKASRKALLLNQREPEQDFTQELSSDYGSEVTNQMVLKAKQAKDFFLLLGPPGTGKTSVALKAMIQEFHAQAETNILLLSYTNRAVDEICEVLHHLPNTNFIRLGSKLSCNPAFEAHLLEKVIENCENRKEVLNTIAQYRIVVATVASLSGKMDVFQLKHFDVAIIDEASQILEPSLLGILSAKNPDGQNAVGKFIMIGDHKQLPAIVLQDDCQSKVKDKALHNIGLFNRKDSLFERLYQWQQKQNNSQAYAMLQKQGRMHPEIAQFPSQAFYNNLLTEVPTKHQTEALHYPIFEAQNPFQNLVAHQRLAFVASHQPNHGSQIKINHHEAKLIKEFVQNIYQLYQINQMDFSAEHSLGIISPYRSQIALIKQEIYSLNIPELRDIMVDTVERFQGSQRDIILYSFSVNQAYQVAMLSNTCYDQGQIIDRKLNVALTRAKKQLIVLGHPHLISENEIYKSFIDFVKQKKAYFDFNDY